VSAQHVLGVLEDDEQRLWATLEQAITVAETEYARLTLAKTTDPGWLMRWFAPAALNAMCVSSEELDFRTAASHKLARAAEFVPGCVPVTTVVLGESTTQGLVELVARGLYDVVVMSDAMHAHSRRLRCALTQQGIRTVLVPSRPPADPRSGDAGSSPCQDADVPPPGTLARTRTDRST
jgi:hypothetical protein